MNNKGFAISIILYSMVILIIAVLYLLLGIVRSRYTINTRLRDAVVEYVNDPRLADSVMISVTSSSNEYFRDPTYLSKITKVEFVKDVNLTNAIDLNNDKNYWDLSESQKESVIGWLESDGNSGYILYLSSDGRGKVVANDNSSWLFSNMNLETVNFNNLFDLSQSFTLGSFFYNSTITTLSFEGIDTSKILDMGSMFANATIGTLDLSSIDVSSVQFMNQMFINCNIESLDLSGFNSVNVGDMSRMFEGCKATSINLSGFKTQGVTNMSRMFYNSSLLTIDLSSFDTSKVTDMSYMFMNFKGDTLDLSSFDMDNVTNTEGMFSGCNITTGYAKSDSDAVILNAATGTDGNVAFTKK